MNIKIIINLSLQHCRLNSHKCITSICLSKIAQFAKSDQCTLKMSTFYVVSYFLSAKVSPEWRLNLGFRTQKKLCPFNRGNRCKDYVGVFLGPEWRCPLKRDSPKERFHCSGVRERGKKRKERGRALVPYPTPSLFQNSIMHF